MTKLKSQLGALSYMAIMLFIGVPLWWKTTEVYRAELPYEAIHALSQVSVLTHKVNLLLITPDAQADHARGPDLQQLLIKSDIFDVTLAVRTPNAAEMEQLSLERAHSLADLDNELGAELSRPLPGWVILLEVPANLVSDYANVIVGNQRVVYFAKHAASEDIAAMVMDTVLGEFNMADSWRRSPALRLQQPRTRTTTDRMRKRCSTGRIDLQLSLLVPEPDYVLATWQIEQAVDAYIKPFIRQLPLKVSINSQVLYLTELTIPGAKEGQGSLEVSGDDLGIALNRVESLLSSQSSSNPALNLIVYIPTIHRTPVTIRGSTTNSFLLPRWGGVHIYNFHTSSNITKYPLHVPVDMKMVGGVWLGQLRALLGVHNVAEDRALPLPATGIRHWELDYQLRFRSQENLIETRSTLQSLSSLLEQISNIVINEDIARRVETALESFKQSSSYLSKGELEHSHAASQLALQKSEAAFFDPSLLALLYFPDDQKYAIYVPYFLPVGLPILISLKSIVKLIKSKDKID